MGLFKNKIQTEKKEILDVKAVPQSFNVNERISLFENKGLTQFEMRLYETLRDQIPIIDAAICKIVRLVGGCSVECEDKIAQKELNEFLNNVQVNSCGTGIETFISIYLEQLLTYGTSIGEMVLDNRYGITALYNASLYNVYLKADKNPLDVKIFINNSKGCAEEVKYPNLILLSTLSPKPEDVMGESILKGLWFVSDILQKIYKSIGSNWERVGNVRFSVTYNPPNDSTGSSYTKERAQLLADEWSKAMRSTKYGVSDFVAIGDVKISTIGADNQILDSQVPVRQMLEQIIAKLSIPPFLLGVSWSTTEKMSVQQADILTSELQAYRRLLNPVISKICNMWLKLNGYNSKHNVVWKKINLQDEVELANARLMNAKALEIEESLKSKVKEVDI